MTDTRNPLYKTDRILVKRADVVACEIILTSSGNIEDDTEQAFNYGHKIELFIKHTRN